MGRDEIPRLQEAAEMEGAWRLGPLGGAPCDVRLTIEEVGFTGPDAPAWRFHGDADCLSGLGVGEVAAWRPGSDGVSLLRADGSIVAFLSRRGRMYEGKEPGNRLLQLTRP